MEKKERNAENIKQVVDVLTEANYRAGRVYAKPVGAQDTGHGSIEMWVGPGAVPVIALQLYGNDDGFEVYAPISQSNRMDVTLAVLRSATTPPEQLKRTERGFTTYTDFTDEYGKNIRVQESSLATDRCVWIQNEVHLVDNECSHPVYLGNAHLTVPMALRVIKALQAFVDGREA